MKELLPIGHLDGLRALVRDMGGDFDSLLAEMGLVDALRGDADQYISHRKLIELTNLAARKLRRPDLGLVWGVRTNPMLLGPLGVAMLNAPTPRRAITLMVSHLPKQNEVLRASLTPLDRQGVALFSLVNQMKRPPSLVQVKERNLGVLLGIMRSLIGARFRPVEIWLSHTQNADLDAYRRAFGMIPLFQKDVCGLVMKQANLDYRVPDHRRQVFDMALAFLEKAAPHPDVEADILARASAVLATNRTYSIVELAKVMGVHVRGLQRRLKEKGFTYSKLRDDVRRGEAERLLLDERRTLVEIAMELGFKDQAAFTRAARRWFGAPPSAARRLLAVKLKRMGSADRTHTLMVARRLRSRPEGV